jgi:hypothetical protein
LPRQQKWAISAAAAGHWFPGVETILFSISVLIPWRFRPAGVALVFGHGSLSSLPRQQTSAVETTLFHRIRADSMAFSARGSRTFFVHMSLSSLPWPHKWGVSAATVGHWFRAFVPHDVPNDMVWPWEPSFSTSDPC